MPIAARFEELPPLPGRARAARRQLLLEAEGATAAGTSAPVLIHNLSATGLLIETQVALGEGERIDIALPEIGPVPAHVVWSSGDFHGCRFEVPVPAAVLSALERRGEAPSPDPAPAAETLPVRIARLRKAQGLTLEALAGLLGVSKPTVWAWEQGKARPAQERLDALADRLGIAREELLTGRDADALGAALARARQLVGEAYGVDPARVRVSIEL